MRSKYEIESRQNEKDMLEALFASKGYFDSALLCYEAIWVSYIISLIIKCFLKNSSYIYVFFEVVVPLVLTFLTYLNKKNTLIAANIRNYFDFQVLGIEDTKSDYSIEEIKKYIYVYCKKHKYNKNISCEANEKLNKFKNWYEISNDCKDSDAVFDCQIMNIYYYNNSLKTDYFIYAIFFIVILMVVVVNIYIHGITSNIISIFLLLFNILKLFSEVIKRKKITNEINGIEKNLKVNHPKRNIEHLQLLLNKRRKCVVLNVGFLYKYIVNSINDEYRSIIKNS